jgi:cytochrome c biogenesis protein CcdA
MSAGLVLLIALAISIPPALAANDTYTAVYFSSVGCTHCARVDPVLLGCWTQEYPGLVVIEYLLSSDSGNGPVIMAFDQRFHTGTSVPFLFFAGGHTLVGEGAILTGGPAMLASLERDPASLVGERFDLETIDLDELQGKPTIWHQDRVLLGSGTAGEGDAVKILLLADDPAAMLAGLNYSPAEPQMLAGGTIAFDHAAVIGGWTLQWNGSAPAPGTGSTRVSTNGSASGDACPPPAEVVSLGAIVSLAAVDAINPCALAVLVVILVGLLTGYPTGRRRVLIVGAVFTMAVFICYLFYGVVLISAFRTETLVPWRDLVMRGLGIAAIILGALHLVRATKPESAVPLTAVPESLRPWLKRAIGAAISPAGAFISGAAVALFLLPCTIGPYVVGCGMLAALSPADAAVYLLLYNAIFVLPMIAITLAIGLGVGEIERVAAWRDKKLRILHLASGIVMIAIGGAILAGFL